MTSSTPNTTVSSERLRKEDEIRKLQRIKRERDRREQAERFVTYAPTNLHLRPEAGGVQPFRLNHVQLHVNGLLDKQLEAFGRVRALILKGRKQGVSTLIGGRFYWKTTHKDGVETTIIAHEQKGSDILFAMVDLFHQHDPSAPALRVSSSKELVFDRLNSKYSVLTAGTKETGRGGTPQFLHGSEVAFWPNAQGHMSGIVQAVPEVAGTEIVLESTAKGSGDTFHQLWQLAEAGGSDYQAIFVPWFMSSHYQRETPQGFALSDEELKYKALYDLTNAQMAWRRAKIASIPDGFTIFKREYPATSNEAFESGTDDSYIPAELVSQARKTEHVGIGPLIIGGDPARFGIDRFSLAWRRGRKVIKIESKQKLSNVEGASWIKRVIDTEKPARVFLDLGGQGAGVYDILVSWGKPYSDIVRGVNFAGAPLEPYIYISDGGGKSEKRPGPKNRRAEMWMLSKNWLAQEGGVDIPDLDSLQADATGPRFRYDVTTQHLVLEKKEDMIKRGLRSPDEWDAVALTFAEPVADLDDRRPKVRTRAQDPTVGV